MIIEGLTKFMATQLRPATRVETSPAPSQFKTLTETTLASLATPTDLPTAVELICVPCPLQSEAFVLLSAALNLHQCILYKYARHCTDLIVASYLKFTSFLDNVFLIIWSASMPVLDNFGCIGWRIVLHTQSWAQTRTSYNYRGPFERNAFLQ